MLRQKQNCITPSRESFTVHVAVLLLPLLVLPLVLLVFSWSHSPREVHFTPRHTVLRAHTRRASSSSVRLQWESARWVAAIISCLVNMLLIGLLRG